MTSNFFYQFGLFTNTIFWSMVYTFGESPFVDGIAITMLMVILIITIRKEMAVHINNPNQPNNE